MWNTPRAGPRPALVWPIMVSAYQPATCHMSSSSFSAHGTWWAGSPERDGLHGAYKIIQAHGGQINVASEEGRGTTFTIHLPLTPGGQPELAHASTGGRPSPEVQV